MRIKFGFVLGVLCFFSVPQSAQAASGIPELLWQPSPGVIAITPSYLYSTVDLEDTDELVTGVGKGTAIQAEWGLVSTLTIGTKFSFERKDTRVNDLTAISEKVREGFNDYEVFAKVVVPLTRTRLHFGISYLMSSESSNFDDVALRGNLFSGANSMKPYFSVQFPMGPFWIGFFGEWRLYEQQKIKSSGILSQTVTGGDELDVYANFEYNSGLTAFGIAAGTFLKQKATVTDVSDSSTSTQESFDKIHAKIYFKQTLFSRLAFILRADYFDTVEQDLGGGVTRVQAKEISGEAGFRVMF